MTIFSKIAKLRVEIRAPKPKINNLWYTLLNLSKEKNSQLALFTFFLCTNENVFAIKMVI